MASFEAFLEVGGRSYKLFRYELSMHQETDTLGRPASPVLGGTILCTLSSPGQQDAFLYQWMLSPTMQQDGKIRLMQAAPKATEKTISFFNAYCTGLDLSFMPGATGGGPASGAGNSVIQLQLSPQRVAVGAIVHDNNWPVASHGAGETFAKQRALKAETEPSALSESIHTVLDVIGMIPLLGEVADGANAAIYAAQGDYTNAALSAAAMVPGAGNVVGAAKLAKRGAKLIANVRGFKQAKKLWRSGADLMEKGATWVGKPQRGSTGFLGSARLSRRELQSFKKQAQEIGAELVVIKDKKMIKAMDDLGVQAGYQSASNKLFVRKGATAYEVTHEMTHAKHRAGVGKEAYEKLSKLEKETYVYDKLMDRSGRLTSEEITHATDYINRVRKEFGLNPIL